MRQFSLFSPKADRPFAHLEQGGHIRGIESRDILESLPRFTSRGEEPSHDFAPPSVYIGGGQRLLPSLAIAAANAVFSAIGTKPKIEYFDMPKSLKSAYQNFSQANLDKLRSIGYGEPFVQLEEGTVTIQQPPEAA